MSTSTDIPATTATGTAGAVVASVNGTSENVVIDGVEIKGEEFSLGDIETPPLEDFKKLMESLEGQDSMFEDDDIESEIPQGTNIRATGAGVFDMDDVDTSGQKWHPDSSDEKGWSKIASTASIEGRRKWPNQKLKPWIGNTYDGGKPYRHKYEETHKTEEAQEVENEPISWKRNSEILKKWNNGKDEPKEWRVTIVTVFTHGTTMSGNKAWETAWQVVDHIRQNTKIPSANGTMVRDPRIAYQTWCIQQKNDAFVEGEPSWEYGPNAVILDEMMDDPTHVDEFGDNPNPEFWAGEAVEELEGKIHMYVEGYNTYHLIDGHAMKEAWGGINEDILLSPKNLQAILDQIQWALKEDTLDGALLSPRMRRIRARGGAAEMITGYNTEFLDTEFSVVSVR
jgi:hypothetical protein